MEFRRSSTVSTCLAVAVVAALSCTTFDLPAEICNPEGLNAKADGTPSNDGCGRCLEQQCCDAVGRCERQDGCSAIVHDAHACVIAANRRAASAERECAKHLSESREADDVYRCMRGSCGAPCGLPVCKVDKAALLIRNAKCDECFAGGCCSELNRCYESRACKLMLECIVEECGDELGPSLKDPAASLLNLPDSELACGDPLILASAPRCVRQCLCRYRSNEQGLPPSDPSFLPVHLAASVFECGKSASCGNDCTPGPDASDAGP